MLGLTIGFELTQRTMNKKIAIAVAALSGVLVTAAAISFVAHQQSLDQEPRAAVPSPDLDAVPNSAKALAALQDVLAAYRKIIVLFADEDSWHNAPMTVACNFSKRKNTLRQKPNSRKP